MSADEGCLYLGLRSNTENIGEEVQWLAAEQFLPRTDYVISKHFLSSIPKDHRYKLILNGHYACRMRRFITPSNVDPLLISLHFTPDVYRHLSSMRMRSFLEKQGPVGCRDLDTLKCLSTIGIPAYFSSCITLTLQSNPLIKKNDYVVCVGLSEELESFVRKRTTHSLLTSDRLVPMVFAQRTRMDIARAFLAVYQGAHCVVTNRLHVALPCLALGTPVLFMGYEDNSEYSRFTGNLDLLHHASMSDIESGTVQFDFDSPPPNRNTYLPLREELTRRCLDFTGYMNPKSPLTIVDPFAYLAKVFSTPRYFCDDYWRCGYIMSRLKLLKASWGRLFLGKLSCDVKVNMDEL